jgi:hypothetical protein
MGRDRAERGNAVDGRARRVEAGRVTRVVFSPGFRGARVAFTGSGWPRAQIVFWSGLADDAGFCPSN